jgi:hypothetical protein
MIRTLLVSIGLALCSAAAAQGAHTSKPAAHASSDTRTDGAQDGYGSNGMVGSGAGTTTMLDDPTSLAGVGKQESASASGPCVYKGVMTDAEIATCRAANTADAKKSTPRRRKK